jgi:hypothetical protein
MPEHTKTRAATQSAAAPWWVSEGEHDCPHCEQTYAYEVEARCFECDAPICPMCIVRIEEHLFCPECRAAEK